MSTVPNARFDVLVVGGGFYGTSIATYLRQVRGVKSVCLVEQDTGLLRRASCNNQARIHNGYHYPRSYTTAYRSRVNLPRFVTDYPQAVRRDFTKLYAIARRNSKVTSRQFERFCADIGARFERSRPPFTKIFDERLIEASYLVEEYAFDVTQLRDHAERSLREAGVQVELATTVRSIASGIDGGLVLRCDGPAGVSEIAARLVFNCTYSGLNHLSGGNPESCSRSLLKHEITEMALVEVPPELKNVGITVMDGSFFSCMPFPSRGLHTLSHVRYTPHQQWSDDPAVNPYDRLAAYPRDSHGNRMRLDAARYVPLLARAEQRDSLFEVKTVLVRNENDDGRPILFERSATLPGLFFVLGGKIDNIYDIIERIDKEPLDLRS